MSETSVKKITSYCKGATLFTNLWHFCRQKLFVISSVCASHGFLGVFQPGEQVTFWWDDDDFHFETNGHA